MFRVLFERLRLRMTYRSQWEWPQWIKIPVLYQTVGLSVYSDMIISSEYPHVFLNLTFITTILLLISRLNAPLVPPLALVLWTFFFFLQLFLPNTLQHTLLCNRFYMLCASFDAYEVKFGCAVWVWGSSKRMVEGGWWNLMTFILSIS